MCYLIKNIIYKVNINNIKKDLKKVKLRRKIENYFYSERNIKRCSYKVCLGQFVSKQSTILNCKRCKGYICRYSGSTCEYHGGTF